MRTTLKVAAAIRIWFSRPHKAWLASIDRYVLTIVNFIRTFCRAVTCPVILCAYRGGGGGNPVKTHRVYGIYAVIGIRALDEDQPYNNKRRRFVLFAPSTDGAILMYNYNYDMYIVYNIIQVCLHLVSAHILKKKKF